MDTKYVRTERNTEVHQYSNVSDYMDLIAEEAEIKNTSKDSY